MSKFYLIYLDVKGKRCIIVGEGKVACRKVCHLKEVGAEVVVVSPETYSEIASEEGGLIAFFSAGAYGFTMSSSYNTRPRTCEILVDGDSFSTIRRRETYEDLITGEKEFLNA